MQAQRQFAETDTDEIADTVIFRPTSKNIRFRKMVGLLMLANMFLVFITTFVSLLIQNLSLFATMLPLFLVVLFATWRFIKQTNGPRPTPIIALSPDGFRMETEPFLGTIPWDEIASVEPGCTLGVSVVVILPKTKRRSGRDWETADGFCGCMRCPAMAWAFHVPPLVCHPTI